MINLLSESFKHITIIIAIYYIGGHFPLSRPSELINNMLVHKMAIHATEKRAKQNKQAICFPPFAAERVKRYFVQPIDDNGKY